MSMSELDREVVRAAVRDGYQQGYNSALRAVELAVGELAATVDAQGLRATLDRSRSQSRLTYRYDGHPGDEATTATLLMHGVALGQVARSSLITGEADASTEEHRQTHERVQFVHDLARDAGERWSL